MKECFLSLHSDFVSFADCPSFAAGEGDDKRALVAEAGKLVRQKNGESDDDLGRALIELLAGRTSLDGSLLVRFQASGHVEMCWHLYAWGKSVEVLQPARLREMVHGHQREFDALP